MLQVALPNPIDADAHAWLLETTRGFAEIHGTVTAATRCIVAGRPSEEQLLAAPDADIIIPFAGVPRETATLAQKLGRRVYNQHHNADTVAEHVLAMMLACSRLLVPMDSALRQGDWTARYGADPGITLDGRNALVLGYGAIGRRVCELLAPWRMTVRATRRSIDRPVIDGHVRVHPATNTRALLRDADVVIIALPSTVETRGLFDAKTLATLPAGSILINVGRAEIVDQHALYDALVSGHLHSAGLDVWYAYPRTKEDRSHTYPGEAKLWELPNVVLSPHRSGHSTTIEQLRAEHLAALLRRLAEAPEGVRAMDLDAGY